VAPSPPPAPTPFSLDRPPPVPGRVKGRIAEFMARRPAASVKEIAREVYGDDGPDDCARARALLHQMRGQGSVQPAENGGWKLAAAMVAAFAAVGVGLLATEKGT
jgi:hypothetical protein